MAVNWGFEEVETEFSELPQGTYRCRIATAEEKMTKTGKPMIAMMLDISGHAQKLFYNLVFDMANQSITNQKLQSIYDSFGIPRGNTEAKDWVGKVGALKTRKEKDQYGQDRTGVHYFLNKTQASKLPAWQEPSSTNNNTSEQLPPLDDCPNF